MSVDVRHPIFARLYARAAADERPEMVALRRRVLAPLVGRVVEVGAGSGVNFPHYPATVTGVLAVEPEPYLRRRAERAAQRAPVPIRVVGATADHLPASSGEYDAVVFSLVLCSVPDPARALAEATRLLRDGGHIRFFEHVVSHRHGWAAVQRALDATIWPLMVGGCHLSRDATRSIEDAGLVIEQCERFTYQSLPHVMGTARKPVSAAP